tara:strand:- start:4276 stop:5295 length:1020 start_codon:yes stop_codon:yes gene_type:complete
MRKAIKTGIIGGSGYTGEELIRLISAHSEAELQAISSRDHFGKEIKQIYPNIKNLPNICFCKPEFNSFLDCDVIFFATPHGFSMNLVKKFLAENIKIIDLSADFRIKDSEVWEKWYGVPHADVESLKESVYGLVEDKKLEISSAKLVAVPGCYPTATLLGILPLLNARKKIIDITCDAKSGLTGAGRLAVETSLSSEMEENFKAYGVEMHRHTPEIEQFIKTKLSYPIGFNFVPHLVPMMRGIYATLYLSMENSNEDWINLYNDFYLDFNDVSVLEGELVPESLSVSNTNKCQISIKKSSIKNQLVIISSIDNLMKGASGQAIQCFNLMNDFDIDHALP